MREEDYLADGTDVKEIIRWKLRKFALWENFEDALQEAYIRAWRDVEAGMTDTYHIVNRAAQKAKAYLTDDHHPATGTPRRESIGRRSPQGELGRAKIENFRNEYFQLHGKMPTGKVVADGVGLDPKTVRIHTASLKTANRLPFITEADGRLNRRAYRMVPIVTLPVREATIPLENLYPSLQLASFENELMSRVAFEELIKSLGATERQIFRWKFIEGYLDREIGFKLGVTKSPQATVNRMVHECYQKIQDQILGVVRVPEIPKCRRGHARSEENTYFRPDGNKVCMDCRKVMEERQRAARKARKESADE